MNDVAQSSDRCRMPASKTLLVLGENITSVVPSVLSMRGNVMFVSLLCVV